MKSFIRTLFAAIAMILATNAAFAAGWPAGYEGVMLQGFWWDSYQTDTKWTKLEAKVDEYSPYFNLIWVPNSAKSSGGLGYHPIYWFTNHNSDMGSEAQLRSMIKAYKEKGVGIIADVVINHRAGMSNWTNFPKEKWNGQDWFIGTDGICCDDEVAGEPGQAKPTGGYDTGEHYGAARDLDHTNQNVQNNCKNYCKCLLEDYGYVGFRLDMVKGYGGQYTKIYNQYSNPTYSVGEYWDGYDAIAAWIEATGRTSAAFDFPFKYACNEAFSTGDMSKLVWKANGTTDQPAGMIHCNYPQYAVTFIDNHDTYRDGSKFTGNVVAANAFMLCSPGTPCVFLPHWNQYKTEIAKLIQARKSVGLSNTSQVRVLRSSYDCYMAEVTGSKGKLVVKIGSAMVSPDGYSDSQIYCSGNGYCVWTTTGGTPGPGPQPGYPATLYLQGHVNGYAWDPSKGVSASGNNGVYTFKDVTIDASPDGPGFFSFCTSLGATWDDVNASDRYGASAKDTPISMGGSAPITLYAAGVSSSGCESWSIAPGSYTIVADLASMTLRITDGSDTPGPGPGPQPGNYPATLYLQGHVNGYAWDPSKGISATGSNGVYTYKDVTVDASEDGSGYFSFCTLLGATWDDVNGSDRYGAEAKDTPIAMGGSAPITLYAVNISAMACESWCIAPGTYTIVADLSTMTLRITDGSDTPGPGPGPGPDPGDYPATLHLMGNINGSAWSTMGGAEVSGNNGVYTFSEVSLDDAGEGSGYFSFAEKVGPGSGTPEGLWDDVNNGNRWGAAAKDTPIELNVPTEMTLYAVNISAMACESWMAPAGIYTVVADLANLTVTLSDPSGIALTGADNLPAEYFNLQGIRVANPQHGNVYIVRRGAKAHKVIF